MKNATGEGPTWLTPTEAAPHFRKTPETLINWATSGRIPSFAWRALPKGYLFLTAWVEDPVFTSVRSRVELSPAAPEEVANASK